METTADHGFVCGECNNDIQSDDEFCPHCGTLFRDGESCLHHTASEAEGVCIVCAMPFCGLCGTRTNRRFLCNHHSMYEIYEGMARIYGVLDDVSAQFATSCLEQAGLHPVLYCRMQLMGGPRVVYTLYTAMGDYDGHIINEIKVMVPCQEVVKAEEVLRDLRILDTPSDHA